MSTTSTNIRQAAILLLSLPQDQAARLLAGLDARQVEAVAIEIANSEPFTADEQAAVIRQFAQFEPPLTSAGKGGLRVAHALVEKALGPHDPALHAIRRSIEAGRFEFLERVDSQDLLAALSGEHPQTIALVVSHLTRARGAQLVARLSSDQQLAVIRGIAARGPVEPEVVEEVASGIARRLEQLAHAPRADKAADVSAGSPSLSAA